MLREQILAVFPERIRHILMNNVEDWEKLQEIRIRCGREVVLMQNREKCVPVQDKKGVSQREIREMLEYISRYSLYAFEEEIKKGYLTIPGGHRIGLAGKVVMDRGSLKTMRHISFINLRISHEKKGCSDWILPFLFENGRFLSTLIVSPPGAGKTTLLRDLVRNLADGNKYADSLTVSVVDERSEIAGCCQGIPQKDLGRFCDVLDACDKCEGIYMMLRSMAPEVIAVDEIGTNEDCEALARALTCGCSIVATVHADSLEQLWQKKSMSRIISDGMFKRIIILRKDFSNWVEKVCDEQGAKIG